MDLVKIGFQINANGLKDANTEVDKLLDKVDNIGTKGKKASSDFESSQKKVKDSTQKVTKEVDKTSKALEKQKIVGDYLGKGLDKTTATSLANFKQLKASVVETNSMFTLLGNNSTFDKTNKQAKAVTESLDKMKLNLDLVGKGFSASEQAQLRQLKLNSATNAQLEEAIGLIKKRRQETVLADYQNQKASLSREWMSAYDKEISSRVAKEQEAVEKIKRIRDTVNVYDTKSRQPFGGGILDQVERQNQGLSELRKQYTDEIKAINDKEDAEEKARQKKFSAAQDYYQQQMGLLAKETAAQKAAAQQSIDEAEKARQKKFAASQKEYQHNMELLEKERHKVKQANDERQNAITLEQAKAKYVSQGYGKTDSTRLARLEVSGADVTTLNNYKSAIEATTRATQALNPAVEKVTTSHSNFLDQVKGIAIYAALSAAIYGVMTAMTNLAVATVKMADEYTSIQNRMKLYITDAKELGKVNSQLAQFSMENNVGLRETATLFSRLAPSMQKLGANTAAITTVVDAFGKSMRIGGATAMEAASATIQFSQAMASGKLAGDEFRSISEASPRFLQAIAEGSGIAADKLKEMSAAGMLTTEVISKALLKEYPKLIEENKKLGITMEQGANAIKTGFLVAIGEFNEGAGITKALGEAMLDLAQGMLTGAQNARQFGKDINDWFSANAGTINTVVDAFKLLATVIATRYVASLVLATAASVKLTYQTSALAAATTASMRAFVLGATAATAFGRAAQTAFAFMGGWAGIALTIIGVAASYLLLRDNAAQATSKIAEQSEYIDLTTEAYKKLNSEQQKNVQVSLTEDMNKTNEELDAQADAVDRVLLSYAQFKQMQGKALNKETSDVINQTVKGLISYDTAYRKLIDLGVPKNVVEDFKKQKDVYDEAAKAALKIEAAARAASLGIKLGGNEAQNASPAIRGLKNDMNDLGEASINAADKFKELVNAYTQGVADIRTSLKVSQQYGLDQSLSDRVVKEAKGLADADERIKLQTGAINKQKEAVAKLSAEDQKRFKKSIEQIEKLAKSTKDKIIGQYIAQIAPSAQGLQAAQDERGAFDAAQRKKDKPPKKSDINNYPEQIAELERLNDYLQSGVGLEVAKVASQKDYVKWYGANLTVAKQIVAIEERRVELERALAQAQTRKEAKRDLKEQIEGYDTIAQFMQQGYSYSVAQQAVSSKFKANSEGISFANNLLTASLKEQFTTTEDQRTQQEDILDFVKGGLSVEEATVKATIYRNNHLNKGLIVLAEATALSKKQLEYDRAKVQYWSDANALNTQANDLAITQDNALASLTLKYKGISVEEAKSMLTKQRIVDKLTEYNDLLEKQKSLALAIESVDFNVFGDFGNPFQSALEGLNALIFGMNDLKTQYAEMYADIDGRIAKEEDGSKAQLALIQQKTNLEKNQVVETKKARDKAITSGLALTKSLFKEESKGYKVVSGLEKAYQASKIAFALWEKKDTIAMLALSLKAHITDMLGFTTGAAAKVAAQQGVNVSKGIEATLNQGSGDPYTAFARMAAMAAAVAALGVAIGSFSGSSGGEYVDTSNQGTGTVFGDSEAQSASIANSIDLLSENSDLMLPLTSAMLRSLRNIESSIGGVTNLILRGDLGGDFSNLEFDARLTGVIGAVDKTFTDYAKTTMNVLTLGLDKILLGGALGNLAGGIVSTVLGGLFGKTSQKVVASGLYAGKQTLGSILENGINLRQYADVKTTKKSWFSSSSSTSTRYSSVDDEIKQQFTLIFEGFYDTILSATDILGADLSTVETNLKNAVVKIGKINLKGLSGEEIQEKLEAVFGAAADSLAKQAFGGLEDFQSVGEGYYETLVKVASAVEEAAYYTDRLNVTAINYTAIINKQADDLAAEIIRQSYLTKVGISTIKGGMTDLVNTFDGSAEEITDFINTLEDLQEQLFMTGKSGDYLTSSMVLGAGGLDSLASGLDAYFEMLSPAEQAAELTRRLTNEFAIFGKELPADVKAFRNLVSSIDITTEAGQKLYGQIIALAPEFNDLQDALDSANSEVNALVQSLRDLAEQARAARGETEQPRDLAYLRNEFNKASELALQGDTEAANRLNSIGKDLMSVSKLYSVTGSDYAKDLAFIQGIATAVADLQESGLGTSISSNLTPSTGNTATPVVSTTNTTTDLELKGMREDLNAGLLAIAKFTQSIDARQDRWDYGDRLLVRVEQDGANDKIPVTTA